MHDKDRYRHSVPELLAKAQPIRFSLEEVEMRHTDTPVIAPEAPDTAEIQHDQLVEDDELVEEISIDGMCGVY
jgi:mycofactocin precursor